LIVPGKWSCTRTTRPWSHLQGERHISAASALTFMFTQHSRATTTSHVCVCRWLDKRLQWVPAETLNHLNVSFARQVQDGGNEFDRRNVRFFAPAPIPFNQRHTHSLTLASQLLCMYCCNPPTFISAVLMSLSIM
jgi:hypothetical protein